MRLSLPRDEPTDALGLTEASTMDLDLLATQYTRPVRAIHLVRAFGGVAFDLDEAVGQTACISRSGDEVVRIDHAQWVPDIFLHIVDEPHACQ
jgi:hypothetical protein